MALDPAWLALAGTMCGGVGLKVAEHYLGKSKVKIDDASRIRDELRIEINTQKEEIKSLELGLEKWRQDYYDLRDQYVQLQTQLTIALDKLAIALDRLKQDTNSLESPKNS